MGRTRRRVLGVLVMVSAALWIAGALSMAAFTEGADQIDEGVNVTALHLAAAALPLTVVTMVLATRPQPPGRPVAQESDPQR